MIDAAHTDPLLAPAELNVDLAANKSLPVSDRGDALGEQG